MEFNRLPIHDHIKKNLDHHGFKSPTPVQEKVIPEALQGRDIRACAQTGTGKTLAFAIPIMDRYLRHPPHKKPKALILTPTRELATQVYRVILDLTQNTNLSVVQLLGGMNIRMQIQQLKKNPAFVVGTPGRLIDHLKRRTLNLKHVDVCVMDEGDRMLDMGFLPDVRFILSHCPKKRQTMLFSATFPPEIQQLVAAFLNEPYTIDLAPSTPANTVTQMVYPVSGLQKEALLQSLLETCNIASALIFCRTKIGADHLVSTLKKVGKSVAVIHSNKTQAERDNALQEFRHKKVQLLVATDIASRGLDIKDISHVINYDVPHHPEDYVHRIGRTGRAQATGDAFTLVSGDEEAHLKRIEQFIQKPLPRAAIPNFPYLVPPRLTAKSKNPSGNWGRMRRGFRIR